jgi:hypothetical protein
MARTLTKNTKVSTFDSSLLVKFVGALKLQQLLYSLRLVGSIFIFDNKLMLGNRYEQPHAHK